MKRLAFWSWLTASAVALSLPGQAHRAEAQASIAQYTWNAGNEGFAALQNPWSRVGGGWGGDFTISAHSARMVSITGLSDAGAQASFASFLDGLQDPPTNLNITLDVFKDSNVGWKPATGGMLPPFGDAYDNSYSSLVMVWLADGGTQYSYGAELNAANGNQAGLTLAYLGSRSETPLFSNLELYLQTYQGAGDLPFNYRIDNLTIAVVPEPASATLLGIGAAVMVLKRRRK